MEIKVKGFGQKLFEKEGSLLVRGPLMHKYEGKSSRKNGLGKKRSDLTRVGFYQMFHCTIVCQSVC